MSTKQIVGWGSVVAAIGIIGTPIWQYGAKPVLVGSVKTAVAAELDEKVKATVNAEVAPLKRKVNAGNAGLKAIIQGNVRALEEDISHLEFIRDQPPADDWTDELRRELLNKQRALATQQAALKQITEAEAG